MRRAWLFLPSLFALTCIVAPHLVHAASFTAIIAEGGACNCNGSDASHIAPDFGCVLQIFQIFMNDFVTFVTVLLTVFLAWAGITYIMNPTSPEKRSQANARITNALIGLMIVLSAWLLVDTIMKVLYNSGTDSNSASFGPWNDILKSNGNDYCIVAQKAPGVINALSQLAVTPSSNSGSSAGPTIAGGGTCSAAASGKAKAAVQYQNQVCADANAAGISGQCNTLLGILGQESTGNPNAQSSVGALGLMQLEPDTAAQYGVTACKGSTRANPSTACVAALKDPTTNIQAGVNYYAKLYSLNKGDVTKATAAYNAGQGANAASNDCPSGTKWQCTINGDGYQQTRDYVTYVNNISTTISQQCK